MTIKNILVLPIGETTDDSAMASALHVARNFGAHITMALVRGVAQPAFSEAYESVPVGASWELETRFRRAEKQKEEQVLASYDRFVTRNEIAEMDRPSASDDVSASLRVMDGYAPDAITSIGGAYDLIVLGRPVNATATATKHMIEAALFATGRPVLVAPPDVLSKLGETVLIGWNRSAQSARAFHAAKVSVLERARRIRLLSVTTGAKDGPSVAEIADNLAWHGITADIQELSPDYRSVGHVLLAEASAIGADLVVIGAFSNSRIRNLVLGGVTKHVLDHATVPVLMAH